MKIIIEQIGPEEEEQIVVRCRNLDDSIVALAKELKRRRDKLTVKDGERILQVDPSEVYYFEAVDNKVFLYTKEKVYETKWKLYELEEQFGHANFIRVSKSVIMNLSKVDSFHPDFNGRYEALMKNNERVLISRQYVPELKKRLGI
ncbi:MAG: LytTR family transcriptional regulator DNA-binding domain-containing protein [Lachnospiraceae bacterium]|nr:LytTR family transcriptional regulator DNA-binding domain-containing protein [Lachnospiraceae bacterium]